MEIMTFTMNTKVTTSKMKMGEKMDTTTTPITQISTTATIPAKSEKTPNMMETLDTTGRTKTMDTLIR